MTKIIVGSRKKARYLSFISKRLMARALWSGNISFGLVTIPVELYSGTQDRDIHFHLVTPDGKCRLREKLYCPETGKEYDFSESAKGYEVAPDQYVIVNPKEFKKLQSEEGHIIEIDKFVPLAEIDPIFFNRSYILSPGKRGDKPYALLREAMLRSDKVAIAHFVMRQHQYLAAIRPTDEALTLFTMNYQDEIRSLKEINLPSSSAKPAKKELDLAIQLIEKLEDHFKPNEYRNKFREKNSKTAGQSFKGQHYQSFKRQKES